MEHWRRLIAVVCAAGALSAQGATASALRPDRTTSPAVTYQVETVGEFSAALTRAAPGDTIRLSATQWPVLEIKGRSYSRQVSITAVAGAHIAGFELEDTTGIRFSDLSLGSIRGWAQNVTIERCSFKDADQLIRVNGGSGWTIQRNRFGQNGSRAAVRFIPHPDVPRIADVLFVNNIMRSTGGNQSGFESDSAGRRPFRPRNIVVANNTILTPRPGVLLANGWEKVPVSERPVIANNIFEHMYGPHLRRGRFISNLAQDGVAAPGVELGPHRLNPDLSPSVQSRLVIGRAARAWAPARDFYNRLRVGLPDRGAIEYRAKR
jgi:hypothetical protein